MVSEEGQEWVSPLGGHQVAKGKGRAGLRSIVGNNKQRILGPERYLYEVGKSPTHDLYTPHILVAKKKNKKNNNKHDFRAISSVSGGIPMI